MLAAGGHAGECALVLSAARRQRLSAAARVAAGALDSVQVGAYCAAGAVNVVSIVHFIVGAVGRDGHPQQRWPRCRQDSEE